jgi:vacuolar-type H+-ATPase subunit I/STV1
MMKFDIPKEKVDEALRNEIKRLEKEKKALQAKLAKAEAKIAEHFCCIQGVKEMQKKFKAIADEYADHDMCGG